MTKIHGAYETGTYELSTPISAVTATTVSDAIPIQGAKKITLFLTRADHSAGSTAYTVTVSGDGTTFVGFNKIISNATNTNGQTLIRVATVTLSSNTTVIASLDLEHSNFVEMKVTATETTDGTHTAKVLVQR